MDATNNEGKAMKFITDLNNDCLEWIFLYLSLKDLSNIANTSKQLKPAAEMAFTRKYGKKKLETTSLQMLRCFGHLITKLETVFSVFPKKRYELLRYVNKYCSETLIEIDLTYIDWHKGQNIMAKPFPKVESVQFFMCNFNAECKNLEFWFPSVRRVEFFGEIPNQSYNQHLPNLDCLEIVERYNTHQIQNSPLSFQLNPQLLKLKLHADAALNILLCANGKHLQMLQYLDICYTSKNIRIRKHTRQTPKGAITYGDVIYLPNLKTLKITLADDYLKSIPKLPILSHHLEEFECHVERFETCNALIEFLEEHPTIKKLSLLTRSGVKTSDKIRMAQALPLLQNAWFTKYFRLTVDELEDFVNQCKMLETIVFGKHQLHKAFGMISLYFGSNWEVEDCTYCIKLTRKSKI